jgi:hypothetical protein
MDAITVHREALGWAAQLLDMVTTDLTVEQAHAIHAGMANPIAATYAHAVVSADVLINVVLAGGAPLFATVWAGRTGISDPRWNQTPEWSRTVQIDLPALRTYAAAAFASADAYIASLDDAGLERELDLTGFGLGVHTVSWVLSALVTGHIHNMSGEISALKGVLGSKGYPF